MTKQRFRESALLSITTGRLIGTDDGGVKESNDLLQWILGHGVLNCGTKENRERCTRWLFKNFPELAYATAGVTSLDGWLSRDRTDGTEGTKMWLAQQRMLFPALKKEYEVEPIPEGWEG